MREFIYDFIGSSTHNMVIQDIRNSILPVAVTRSLAPIGNIGIIYQGSKIGARSIAIDVLIKEASKELLQERIKAIAAWLNPEKGLRPLQLPDMENIAIDAVVDGNTDFERIVTTGRTTITFLCPEALYYGLNGNTYNFVNVTNNTILSIVNPGTYKEEPTFIIRNDSTAPDNLCPNPGFETSLTGWTYQNTGGSAGNLIRDTSQKHSGTASGKLTKNSTVGTPRCYFTLSGYTAGQTYKFKAWVRSEVADGLTVYAEEETPEFQYPQVSDTMLSGTAGTWREISADIVPTATGGTVFIFFEARKAEVYSSWIDDVSLYLSTDINEVVNPGLVLGGKTIRYNGTLSAGQALAIDMKKWTADVDGVNVLPNITGEFFGIEPGTNNVTFISNGGTASITTTIYGRWL